MADTLLLEFDPLTGTAREIADYRWPSGYRQRVTGISAFDGRLWSVSEFLGGYGSPPATVVFPLGSHDLETGDYEELVMDFGYEFNGHLGFTLDLVDVPEQQPTAIPSVGRFGLAVIVVLIGLAGVLIGRRVL